MEIKPLIFFFIQADALLYGSDHPRKWSEPNDNPKLFFNTVSELSEFIVFFVRGLQSDNFLVKLTVVKYLYS